MNAEEYLTVLTGQIRCKLARDGVKQEIRGHLEDQKEYFLAQGMEPAKAEAQAVREMGDPVEAGVALDRIHRPRMPWGMISLIMLLSLAGYLAQYLLQLRFYQVNFILSASYPIYILAGGLIMMGVCFLDYTRIGSRAREITIILLLLLCLGKLCTAYRGGFPWLLVGPFSVNVRVLVFAFVPLYGGILYRYRGQGYAAAGKAVLWMLPALAVAWLYSSLTTSVMLLLSFIIVFSAAVWKGWFAVSKRWVLTAAGGFIGLSPVIGYWLVRWFGTDYQVARIMEIMNPSGQRDYLFAVVRQVMAASRMVGSSEMPIDQLVPGSCDYVLLYIISCYGIFAAVLLTGMMLLLFLGFLRISLVQKNQLGMVMGTGCAVVLLIQVAVCILVNTGVLPGISVYCPFITNGGTGTLLTYFLMGLLLSICRYQHVLPETAGSPARPPKWQIRLVIERK